MNSMNKTKEELKEKFDKKLKALIIIYRKLYIEKKLEEYSDEFLGIPYHIGDYFRIQLFLKDYIQKKPILRNTIYNLKKPKKENKENKEKNPELFNSGQRWQKEEIEELKVQFNKQLSIKEIAKLHGRTNGSILCRLKSMGLIDDFIGSSNFNIYNNSDIKQRRYSITIPIDTTTITKRRNSYPIISLNNS